LRRYGYLNWVEQTCLPATLDDIKRLMSCHDAWAPCRHGGPNRSYTEWTVIGLPARRKVMVSSGPSCSNPFIEVDVP